MATRHPKSISYQSIRRPAATDVPGGDNIPGAGKVGEKMNYKIGQLVCHRTLGLGKVLKVNGDKITVFFKDVTENPQRTIAVNVVPLEIPKNQSDPGLDTLDLEAIKSVRSTPHPRRRPGLPGVAKTKTGGTGSP
jgi:hypothetical protein